MSNEKKTKVDTPTDVSEDTQVETPETQTEALEASETPEAPEKETPKKAKKGSGKKEFTLLIDVYIGEEKCSKGDKITKEQTEGLLADWFE